jgi:zinc protease
MMFQGSENVEKEMHFKYIQEAGGSLNGSTSMDRTNYYETLPSDSLELALWLESDRMGYLLPSLTLEKLDNQKDVVMNERRQNYENQPYGLAWELLFSNLFPVNHPYHWPTIGWMKDIQKFKMSDVKHFFKEYYSPGNASLVIGGSFDEGDARELVHKYFGTLKNGKNPNIISTSDIVLSESKFILHEDNVQLTRIYYGWHSDKAYGEDDAALDILADIISGSKNSRLYKKLVHDLKLVQDVSTFQYSANYNGVFFIIASVNPDTDPNIVHEYVIESINDIVKKGIEEKELERAINGFKSSFIYSLQNLDNMTNQINNYNCNLKEPNSFIYDINRYNSISCDKIVEVAKKYLTKNFVKLSIVPRSS